MADREKTEMLRVLGPSPAEQGRTLVKWLVVPGVAAGFALHAAGYEGWGILIGIVAVVIGLAGTRPSRQNGDARRIYKAAEAAVRGGRLVPSWAARRQYLDGLLVVDECGRQIFINGSLHAWEQVRAVEHSVQGSWPEVRVVLSTGGRPVKSVMVGTHDEALQAAYRLANAVGRASIRPINQNIG